MWSLLLSSLLISLASGVAVPNPDIVSYEGYKVFRVKTQNNPSLIQEKLSALIYDEWSVQSTSYIDIAIPPHQLDAFEKLGLDYDTMHDDLAASIAEESASGTKSKRQSDDQSWFDSYHDFEDHVKYFDHLQASFPNNSKIISLGKSYEGRDIFGIHLWGASGPGKPAVLYHGTAHGRDWINAMILEYITLHLIRGINTDDGFTQETLDSHDFYIIPFTNPDGFVYSRTTDRLWRKNRMPPPPSADQSCIGRDPNRNWPYQWDSNPKGSSSDPCEETYRGEAPADSPEIRHLVEHVNDLRDKQGIKLFIDWLSYGQRILAPWSWSCTQYPETLGQHIRMARVISDSIYFGADRTTFTYGPSCSAEYAAAGSSIDYLYGPGKAKWTFAIESADTGDNGFVLPPALIRGTAEEQYGGQLTMWAYLDDTFFEDP